jgi:hypothetical protein
MIDTNQLNTYKSPIIPVKRVDTNNEGRISLHNKILDDKMTAAIINGKGTLRVFDN